MLSTVTKARSVNRLLAAAALAAAALASPSLAADAKLLVQPIPSVIYPGQSSLVNVLAAKPPAAYAFASTQFDVFNFAPAWTAVSAGVIAGTNVLGINAGQPHNPFIGVTANPDSPLRIWSGVFTPASYAPAMVQFIADPAAFHVHPSKLTASAVPVPSDPGVGTVMINPVRVNGWGVAPRAGTGTTIADDVIVDGRIITAENYELAKVGAGTLVLSGASTYNGVISVAFDRRPETFTAAVETAAKGRPWETFSLNFEEVKGAPLHQLGATMGARTIMYRGFQGGVFVAAGDLGDAKNTLVLSNPPSQFRFSTGDRRHPKGAVVATVIFPHGVLAGVIGADDGEPVALDTLEIIAVPNSAESKSGNNLRQLGLGVHTFDATGVNRMALSLPKAR